MNIDFASVGFLLIIAGIILLVASSVSGKETKFAVGGVIGFIPFGFGNDPQLVKVALIITAVLAIIFIAVFLRGVP